MKFKHRELFLGILIGAIIFGFIGTLADDLYNIMSNPFKIKVNGVEKNIEGYNINGYSYFKLRDIGEQVGFEVDFKEDTILIDDKQPTFSSKSESYWINQDIYVENDIKYYRWSYFEANNILSKTYIDAIINNRNTNDYNMILRKKNVDNKKSRDDEIVLENIEYKIIDDRIMISEHYFNDYILPLDK